MKRSLTLLPAALLLATTLAACASDDGTGTQAGSSGSDTSSSDNAAMACAVPGSVSEALTLDGDFAEAVKITSELPAQVSSLEKSTLVEGDGSEITETDEVLTVVQVFDGRDGSLIEHTATVLSNDPGVYSDWVVQSINCSSVGDRVAIVVPAVDVYGADNIQSMGADAPGADDALVIVSDFTGTKSDFLDTLLEQADGETMPLPDDAPTVEVDETGFPEITIPETDAPEQLTIHTLVKGDGEIVEDGDSVYVHYRGVIWETGEEFDSSWSRGTHIAFSTGGVIGGFREALVGQTVGSRVISIVPAEDGGYGAATLQSQGHAPDAVMVFVLDILGTSDFPPIN